jgi:hypothetical protein
MRAFDRDLIRGGYYGQRSCKPKAEHMATPTNAALVKKVLANSQPSTHGPSCHFAATHYFGRFWDEADIEPDLWVHGLFTPQVGNDRGNPRRQIHSLAPAL